MMDKSFFAAAAFAAFSVWGCFESGDKDRAVDFDRAGLLENLADRLILPAYGRLEAETSALKASVDALADSPDSARAQAARDALRRAWTSWQAASAYELGPAAEVVLRQRMNTFPAKVSTIEANVKAGRWNLESVSNYEAKGFPALDYLLHGRGGSVDSLLAALADPATGESRGEYMRALADEIASKAAEVLEAWDPTGGDYRKTFVSRLGTDIGSSLGELVNQFNFDYEILKNPKIGIPAGKKTLGVALPEKVEAYYAGYSAALARAHLDALENFFRGRDSSGVDSLGFDDYLDALGTRYQEGRLSEAIKDRFAAAREALDALDDPLSETIIAEPVKVDKAYEEIQRMVVLTKTDMPSAMSVSITYQDSDGD
jgi:predicted lipoprotein